MFISAVVFWALLFVIQPVFAQLTINLVAVNADEEEEKEIEIRYELPEELEPEDILDTGPLEVDYDVNKERYLVKGQVSFKPKESKTFKIKVNDVWHFKSEEMDNLKTQLDSNLKMLEKHENYPAAKRARNLMIEQLDQIFSMQTQYSQNIERRIEEYRSHRKMLEEIRNNIYSMDFLKFESKALEEQRDAAGVVKLQIEVQNPHDSERTIVHKHYLPSEIREEHIVDTKGFEVRFDEEAEKSFLTKEETFKPQETKKYEIEIRDIWDFPLIKVDDLEDRTIIAVDELQGTIYEDSSNRLLKEITTIFEKIRNSQENQEALNVREHIGLFRLNHDRYEDAKKNFERIEEMIAIVRAKKLEQLEQGKVKNVLQRLKALRGLSALAEALFKKSISVTVTWRIIMGSIIFVALFTTIHFIIWSKRSGRMGEELSTEEGIVNVPKPGEGGEEEEEA